MNFVFCQSFDYVALVPVFFFFFSLFLPVSKSVLCFASRIQFIVSIQKFILASYSTRLSVIER